MHTFCKYVFVKSYADKFLKSYADKKENYTREKPSYVCGFQGIVLFT